MDGHFTEDTASEDSSAHRSRYAKEEQEPRHGQRTSESPYRSTSSEKTIEASIVQFLSKEKDNEALLTKVSLFLRARGSVPRGSLKRFILERSHCFLYMDCGDGRHKVRLKAPLYESHSGKSSRVLLEDLLNDRKAMPPVHDGDGFLIHGSQAQDDAAADPHNLDATSLRSKSQLPIGIPPDFDTLALERHLVAMAAARPRHSPANMPVLGESCIACFGFSMKGLLGKFLADRPHLFVLPDDGRQHVLLAPGACESVGLPLLACLPDEDDLLDRETIHPSHDGILNGVHQSGDALRIAEENASSLSGTMMGGLSLNDPDEDSNSEVGASQASIEASLMPCGTVAACGSGSGGGKDAANRAAITAGAKGGGLTKPIMYHHWDPITQRIYDYVVSKGGTATFQAVDSFMKRKDNQILLLSNGFANPSQWHAKNFSFNRRNIFRKEGPRMTILSNLLAVPNMVDESRAVTLCGTQQSPAEGATH